LHRLQRQLRAIDNERRTYSDEARAILCRQKLAIEQLRRDNQFLNEDLRLLKMQLMDDKKSGPNSKRAEYLKEESGNKVTLR
jgi:hypothetical protein